jgi:diguanylate cyclase (GGDEF)-like protein
LFAVYVGVSLIPVVLLGIVLMWHDTQSGGERALAQGRAQADVITQMAIAPALSGQPLSAGLTKAEMTRLWSATDLAVYSGSLNALRLRSFDGEVVFADNGTRTDPLSANSPEFQLAVQGGTPAEVVTAPSGSGDKVIRVLQAVAPRATGQATGILELYLPYEPIAAVIRAQQQQTQMYLAGGLGVLYLVLGLVSWSTTRRLRHYAQEQTHQARHDSLTELPNRGWFRFQVDQALARVPDGSHGAVVLVDLDHFKEVNDTIGHQAGDELLRTVAHRLSAYVRTDDVVARLGGDEFGILLPGVTSRDEVLGILRQVQTGLTEPITLGTVSLTIEASFGVALYPRHGTSLSQLMHNADTAMYHGKRGSDRIVAWDPVIATAPTNSHMVRAELQRAIDENELELHYQPKIDLASGCVRGVEALVRWNHPQRGLVPPSDFIPVAESSMLIHPLTSWVLRRALADRHEWQVRGVTWPVSVNVSAHNIESPAFADEVLQLVAASSSRPQDLVVELTETAIVMDSAVADDTLARLTAGGVSISLDDFGTGNTGLQQLRHVPVREVKIDAMFVRDLAASENDRDLVAAMIDISHRLGARVVAEGIEDVRCADWLRSMGCDLGQGYFFQRPARWPELAESYPIGAQASDRQAVGS